MQKLAIITTDSYRIKKHILSEFLIPSHSMQQLRRQRGGRISIRKYLSFNDDTENTKSAINRLRERLFDRAKPTDQYSHTYHISITQREHSRQSTTSIQLDLHHLSRNWQCIKLKNPSHPQYKKSYVDLLNEISPRYPSNSKNNPTKVDIGV